MSIFSISDAIARSFGTLAPADTHHGHARAHNDANAAPHSHGTGHSSTQSKPDLGFLKTTTFKRPQANMFVAINGVTMEDITAAPKLRQAFAHSSVLTDHSFPSDVVSAAVSMATGVPASVHGVVGGSWTNPHGVAVNAFSDDSSRSHVATMADIVSQTFDGKSWSVSVSGNPALAAAFCVHNKIRKTSFAVCPSYDSQTRSFGDSLRADWPTQSHAQIAADFATNQVWRSVNSLSFNAQNGQFAISFMGTTVTFNMNQEVDFALFAELQYMSDLVTVLESMNGLRDGFPDMFSFTIDSLKGIAKTYGRSSPQYGAAVHVIDAVVDNLMTRISALYGGRVLTEIVLWGHSESQELLPQNLLDQEKAAVVTVLREHSLPSVADDLEWPATSIHVPLQAKLSVSQLAALCQDLAIAARYHRVHCPTTHMAQLSMVELASALSLPVPSTASSSSSGFKTSATDKPDPALYQIVLWFSIGAAFVLLMVVYSLCCMEFKRDTLLYSRFNPTSKHSSR